MSVAHKPSFFSELKRRKVVQVALAYAAVAFALLEGADLAVPRLDLPDWTITFLLVLVLFAFPIALVLAWAFDVTPEGIKRTGDAHAAAEEGWSTSPAWFSMPMLLMVVGGVAIGVGAGWMAGRGASPEGGAEAVSANADAPIRSVAVLAFENMSGDASNEYFSDGISEELLNVLSSVADLKVAARTSAFAFKGTNTDIREVGKILGVQAVVEGSVRRAGNRVRITAQLIQVSDGFHLWSDTYDRELTDIFAVQDEIANAIAEQLQVTLGITRLDRAARGQTDDLEAYDLYLLGRDRFAVRSEETLRQAINFFESAIEQDPGFALAYSGLADSWAVLPWYTTVTGEEVYPFVREAALRGLELNPELAETQTSVAYLAFQFDWDWDTAEERFQRALELNPNYIWAQHWYALHLTVQARPLEAIDMARRAVARDPLSTVVSHTLQGGFRRAGRRGPSIAEFERVASLDPPIPNAYIAHATALWLEGREEGARYRLRGWAQLVGYPELGRLDTWFSFLRGEATAQEAGALVDDMITSTGKDSGDFFSWFYQLGDEQRILEEIRRAVKNRSVRVPYLRGYLFRWDQDRALPESVSQLLDSIGLPRMNPGG